jgi:hypothetical protein
MALSPIVSGALRYAYSEAAWYLAFVVDTGMLSLLFLVLELLFSPELKLFVISVSGDEFG